MNYIDLFAGAGGLSEGFIRSGYHPIAHVEMDTAACYTLKTRVAYNYLKRHNRYDEYISYLKGNITRSQLYALIPTEELSSVINLPIGGENNEKIHRLIQNQLGADNVDLIIGGPPCQAYSLVGRARSSNGMSGDPRNYLYVQYARYLEKYTPKMFVFENVLGLKSANGGVYLENMEKLFLKKGYNIKLFMLDALKFGVLQKRKRIIILGWREGLISRIPELDKIDHTSNFKINCILNDLPFLTAGDGVDKYQKYTQQPSKYLIDNNLRNGINVLTQHVSRPHNTQDKEIYRMAVNKWNSSRYRLDYNDLPERLKTHKNRNSFFDRFKVVAGDLGYSHTVVAHIAKDGHYYIHPDINQNRSISVREAARLQSFPDDYYFEGVKENGNRTAAFKQIGNAVPPLMSTVIAKVIKKLV